MVTRIYTHNAHKRAVLCSRDGSRERSWLPLSPLLLVGPAAGPLRAPPPPPEAEQAHMELPPSLNNVSKRPLARCGARLYQKRGADHHPHSNEGFTNEAMPSAVSKRPQGPDSCWLAGGCRCVTCQPRSRKSRTMR